MPRSVLRLRFAPLTGLAVLVSFLLLPGLSAAQTLETRTLTLEGAKTVASAASEVAAANDWNVVIVVVDAGGHLLYLERMDGVRHGILDIAMGKAKTSAAFGSPTRVFADMVGQGSVGFLAIPGTMPIEGGVPILVEGQVIGAIGVSGVTGEQDGIIAQAGAAAVLD
jgi:glc operon protein GlcG